MFGQTSSLRWQIIKNADLYAADSLLRENEGNYVGACSRFLTRGDSPVWVLREKTKSVNTSSVNTGSVYNSCVKALVISSKSTLMPVLCGEKNIPSPDFLDNFTRKKNVHSIQGLTNEVSLLEKEMKRLGWITADIFDYNLMTLDKLNKTQVKLKSDTEDKLFNLVLKKPQLTDIDAISPLQAGYEKEEVVPKGSEFSPAASRINTANIIAGGQILAAELNGRYIGKINVSAVSYTRFQVGGVYVHPDFRGLGVGRKMVFEFTSSLLRQNKGVTLFVKKTNTAARRLYTSLGFAEKGDYRITYY